MSRGSRSLAFSSVGRGLIGWNNGEAADAAVLGWTCHWTCFIVKLGPRFKCKYKDP